MLTFASMAAIQAALTSPEGVAATADRGHILLAGVELRIFDTRAL